ncbi:MAG: hypothetical protein ACLT8H_03770 [Streptococcus parasanguinis]
MKMVILLLDKLLKDKYILTEIEAPSGHIIKEADTVVNVEDFGADHSVTKTIVNPKEETTTTNNYNNDVNYVYNDSRANNNYDDNSRADDDYDSNWGTYSYSYYSQQLQSQQQLQRQLKNLQLQQRRLKSQQLQQRRQKVQNLRRLRQQLQLQRRLRLKTSAYADDDNHSRGPTTKTAKPGNPGDSGTTTSNGGRKTFLPKQVKQSLLCHLDRCCYPIRSCHLETQDF